ncbi:hypothetical protein ABEY41_27640 [Peribacillus butanolivorans]|uniref:hypothetical protein n=1 Tax=Peribacillus butanolivorans TaxID=421767 RepID=UPI003D2C051B
MKKGDIIISIKQMENENYREEKFELGQNSSNGLLQLVLGTSGNDKSCLLFIVMAIFQSKS